MTKGEKTEWLMIIVVIVAFVSVIGGYLYCFYIIYRDGNRTPVVNKIVKVGDQFELCDTLQYCDEFHHYNHQYFSVYKQDSTATIEKGDICNRCGKTYEKHSTADLWVVKEISTMERE